MEKIKYLQKVQRDEELKNAQRNLQKFTSGQYLWLEEGEEA